MKNIFLGVLAAGLLFLSSRGGYCASGSLESAVAKANLSFEDILFFENAIPIEVPEPDRPAPAEQETPVCVQEQPVSWAEYPDDLRDIREPRALVQKPFTAQAAENIVGRFKLSALENAYMNTKITFMTAAGDTVHVSGAKASDCVGGGECNDMDRYFLIFHTDRGQTIFVKGDDIANIFVGLGSVGKWVKTGEKDIYFDGDSEKYTAKLYVDLIIPKNSTLEVKNCSRVVLKVTLGELTEAIFEAGQDLKLGRRYIMTYANRIFQDGKGAAYMGRNKVFVFMLKGKEDVYYSIPESKITSSGVTFPEMEKNYAFRIVDGFFEIYSLSAG